MRSQHAHCLRIEVDGASASRRLRRSERRHHVDGGERLHDRQLPNVENDIRPTDLEHFVATHARRGEHHDWSEDALVSGGREELAEVPG